MKMLEGILNNIFYVSSANDIKRGSLKSMPNLEKKLSHECATAKAHVLFEV